MVKNIQLSQGSVDSEQWWAALAGVEIQSPQGALDDELGLPAGRKFQPPQELQEVYLGPQEIYRWLLLRIEDIHTGI